MDMDSAEDYSDMPFLQILRNRSLECYDAMATRVKPQGRYRLIK
jgi:hypothetical protein